MYSYTSTPPVHLHGGVIKYRNKFTSFICYFYLGIKERLLQIGRSLVRSQLVLLEFFIEIKSFRSHYGPGVDSASNRNEYQEHLLGGKGSRCVRLTTLPPSCAVVMKSGNLNFLEPPGPLQACNGTALPLPYKREAKASLYRYIFPHV